MKYRHTRRSARALLRPAQTPRGMRWRVFGLGVVALGLVLSFDLGGRLNPQIVHMVERKTEYLVEVKEVQVARACPQSMRTEVRETFGGHTYPMIAPKAPSRVRKGR